MKRSDTLDPRQQIKDLLSVARSIAQQNGEDFEAMLDPVEAEHLARPEGERLGVPESVRSLRRDISHTVMRHGKKRTHDALRWLAEQPNSLDGLERPRRFQGYRRVADEERQELTDKLAGDPPLLLDALKRLGSDEAVAVIVGGAARNLWSMKMVRDRLDNLHAQEQAKILLAQWESDLQEEEEMASPEWEKEMRGASLGFIWATMYLDTALSRPARELSDYWSENMGLIQDDALRSQIDAEILRLDVTIPEVVASGVAPAIKWPTGKTKPDKSVRDGARRRTKELLDVAASYTAEVEKMVAACESKGATLHAQDIREDAEDAPVEAANVFRDMRGDIRLLLPSETRKLNEGSS